MKPLTIFIFFITTLLHGQTKSKDDFKLKGVWTVTKYTFCDISAMDDKIAQEWIGKKATVLKVIHFPYYNIPSYKDIFKNDCYCGYIDSRHLCPDTVISTEKYFSSYKINYSELGIKGKTIRLVRMLCKETPFGEVIVKNDNEIIIYWDGVFFTLTRDKK